MFRTELFRNSGLNHYSVRGFCVGLKPYNVSSYKEHTLPKRNSVIHPSVLSLVPSRAAAAVSTLGGGRASGLDCLCFLSPLHIIFTPSSVSQCPSDSVSLSLFPFPYQLFFSFSFSLHLYLSAESWESEPLQIPFLM